MMKFRPFLLIAAALLISTTAIGCSPEPEESETPSRKMTTAAQQESELKITRSEAANLAQAHIEAKLAQGNVLEAVKNAANTEPSTMVMQAAHTMKRTTAIQSNARQPVGDMTAMEMLLTNINSTQLYISMEKPVLLHQVILCCPKTD